MKIMVRAFLAERGVPANSKAWHSHPHNDPSEREAHLQTRGLDCLFVKMFLTTGGLACLSHLCYS